MSQVWRVYLSGEIHSDWRKEIEAAAHKRELPVEFLSPNLSHESSDACGEALLGKAESSFWRDHKAAKVNAIRNRKLMATADLVVVRFGEKFKQWNAAFDAGLATAMGKSLVVMHDPKLTHALKEVDAGALAVLERPEQVVELLVYVVTGKLP